MRGIWAVAVMVPKAVLDGVVLGAENWVLLKALMNSQRNSSQVFSVK